jgi:hypothetical protein
MRKSVTLTVIAIVLIAATLLGVPALAAGLEYTKTLLYFNVGALDEVTVTLVNEGAGTTTSGAPGTQTSSSLNFTCGTPSCLWVNASLSGTGSAQNDATPAVTIDNTGTTNAQINISANTSFPVSCGTGNFNLRFSNNTITNPPTQGLNTTNVTLVAVYTPVQATIKVWLFGNFSECTQQVYVSQFNVWAYFT